MRRFLTLFSVASLVAITLAPAVNAAPNAPAQTVSPYAAVSGAGLLDVDASLSGTSMLSLDLAPVATAVDTSALPRSTGRAANLDGALLDGNVSVSDILSVAEQSAPQDNASPQEAVLVDIPENPLVDVDVSRARTHARWPGDGVCLAPGQPIVQSFTETAAADVLTIDQLGGSLLTLTNGLGGAASARSTIVTDLVAGQQGRSLSSVAETQIDGVTLFQGTPLEFTVEVGSVPSLTAMASGAPGGATVDFAAPVVNISTPDGSDIPDIPLINLAPKDELGSLIDQISQGLEDAVQATLGDAGIVEVDIVLGDDTLLQTTAPDGTAATAAAAAAIVRVVVLSAAGPDPLVDATVVVAPLSASVVVPAGGIDCGNPENPLRELHKDVSQRDVAPGATFDYTLTVPNRGPCTLTGVTVSDTVKGAPGFSVQAVPAPTAVAMSQVPPGATDELQVLSWDIGDLAPNQTATFTLTVTVPANAPDGYVFTDDLTARGTCNGTPVEQKVTLQHPKVSSGFAGPCDLRLSNKSASHLEVFPGETFNYFIHVFNAGSEPCSAVSVSDDLDPRLAFVGCTGGCTNTAQAVRWSGKTVPGGSGTTLTVTVQVRDDSTGVLANAAVIDSPDDDGPVTVTHVGPQITQRSVPAPPDPPGLDPIDPPTTIYLPRTGGEIPLALLVGLAGVGLLTLAVRRRMITAG